MVILRYGGLEMVSGLENTLRSAERGISRVGFVRPLCDFRRRLVLNARISSRPIAFGAGFVLTVAQDSGTSTVNVAEGVSPGVVQKIFESVLNGSRYLDVSFHQVIIDKKTKDNPFENSDVMCCYLWKFRLAIGLHSSCSISTTAGVTCQKYSAKYITTEWTPHSVCRL